MADGKDDDILKEAREAFKLAEDAEADNRRDAEDDIKFALLDEQWPADIRKQREQEQRPCLTINKLRPHILQVSNDARQNKPSIKVSPVDGGADIQTAKILDGLVRHIQTASGADAAYDTAAGHAIASGFGYWRIGLEHTREDSFDLDLTIKRIGNQFSVFGDPNGTEVDSSDWNTAFVVESVPKATFKRLYPKATETDWDAVEKEVGSPWVEGQTVQVAEYWTREEYEKTILKIVGDDGTSTVISEEDLAKNAELSVLVAQGILQVEATRQAKCWKVRQHTLTGAEVLDSRDWPGQYIPIIPVYGEEVNLKGKRYFRSLIRSAKDPQRMHNFWRTAATEAVALAPKVPFIGPVGAFETDATKWATANRVSHAFIEYDPVQAAGNQAPQRQPLDGGAAAGAIQEALMAADDIKAVTGQHDASLGARSNETSGRAIMARQREGDVATFHFQDNVSRAIRQTGVQLVELIPKIYDKARVVRILGEDGTLETVPVNQPSPQKDPKTGQPMMQTGPDGQPVIDPQTQQPIPLMGYYDLTAGKYDVTVKAGPSFTTRREEAAYSMTEALRAFPDAGAIILPELAKNSDWPGADDIARKLEEQANGGIPPEVEKQVQEQAAQIEALAKENEQLKSGAQLDAAKMQAEGQKAQTDAQLRAEELAIQREQLNIERQRLAVEMFKAQTDRMQAEKPAPVPTPLPQRAA